MLQTEEGVFVLVDRDNQTTGFATFAPGTTPAEVGAQLGKVFMQALQELGGEPAMIEVKLYPHKAPETHVFGG